MDPHTPSSHTPSSHTPSSHTPSSHTPSSHTPSSHTPSSTLPSAVAAPLARVARSTSRALLPSFSLLLALVATACGGAKGAPESLDALASNDAAVSDAIATDAPATGGDTTSSDGSNDALDAASNDAANEGAASAESGGETSSDTAGETVTVSGVCGSATTIVGCGVDTDGDGITDEIEGRFATGGPVDTDGDGTPDYLDCDSDNDTIPDAIEWRTPGCATPIDPDNDADGDGVPNFQSTDSDGNGLLDKDEVCPPAAVLTLLSMPACEGPTTPYDFDGDGTPDWVDLDNDHDSIQSDKTIGLADKTELHNLAGAYVGLVDTDGDGIPDVYDRDSDNDFIYDLEDGAKDPDNDGKPNFQDTDSDGDGVPDSCEARGNAAPTSADLDKPLVDTNGNGIFDYLDLDSDGDYLRDNLEDKNGNCIVDTGETNRIVADTDGDGASDFVEVTLGTDPQNAASNPDEAGDFYFIEPYSTDGSIAPSPVSETLAMSTTLHKGDVAFSVDTTLSMDSAIAALKTSLSSTIIPALSKRFTDLAIGVDAHNDFPTNSVFSGSGSAVGGLPFYIPAHGLMSTVATDPVTAVGELVTSSGGDLPESQITAMWMAIGGGGVSWTNPAGSIAATPSSSTTFGALQFRDGTLPIIIPITDYGFHDGKRALNTKPSTPPLATDYDTTDQFVYGASVVGAPDSDTLVTAMNAVGAKIVGVSLDDGEPSTNASSPYGFMAYLADKTQSYVLPSAFPGAIPNCLTAEFGQPNSPDGPMIGTTQSCRLVFSTAHDGTGLGTTVVDAVGALLNAINYDVHVTASPDAADSVDAVDDFINDIAPQPTGGTDPTAPTGSGSCVTFSASVLKDKYHTPKAILGPGDILETIGGVNPGKLYCFDVVPKANTLVAPTTTAQVFHATLEVDADNPSGGTIALGATRQVIFIVPPTLN